MIVSLDMIRKAVDALPLGKETKESIIESTDIIISFREHLMERHGVNEKEAEDMLRKNVQNEYRKVASGSHPDMDKAINIIHDYATNEEFENAEGLKDAISKMYNIQSNFQ